MSTKDKIKVYKNPARNQPDAHKPYVPQYQLMGVEPGEYKSPLAPDYQGSVNQAPPSQDNPRNPRPAIRQPYAEAVQSPIGRGRGPLPNVGNNIEQTWSGVDGEIIDDLSEVDSNHTMVDNNEFVSATALGLPEEPVMARPLQNNVFVTEEDIRQHVPDSELSAIISNLEEEEYLLILSGEVICSGPLNLIQEQTRLLVFGEHEYSQGNPASVDDIIVIKRIKIKVGVFLE